MFTDLALGLILIDILTKFAFVLKFGIIVSAVLVFLYVIGEHGFKPDNVLFAQIKKYLKFAVPAVIVWALIPSKQTLYIALGLHTTGVVATQVAESEVGKKALNALEVKLDEILEQSQPAQSSEDSK